MFLLNWLKQYYELQAEHKASLREAEYCESCEVLKLQLSLVNDEKKQLLNRLLIPTEESKTEITENPKAILPKHMNFAIRRQMLEAEDREKAKRLRDNKAVVKSNFAPVALTTAEIEKELGVADAN